MPLEMSMALPPDFEPDISMPFMSWAFGLPLSMLLLPDMSMAFIFIMPMHLHRHWLMSMCMPCIMPMPFLVSGLFDSPGVLDWLMSMPAMGSGLGVVGWAEAGVCAPAVPTAKASTTVRVKEGFRMNSCSLG